MMDLVLPTMQITVFNPRNNEEYGTFKLQCLEKVAYLQKNEQRKVKIAYNKKNVLPFFTDYIGCKSRNEYNVLFGRDEKGTQYFLKFC